MRGPPVSGSGEGGRGAGTRGPPVSDSRGRAVHRGPGPRGWSTAGPRNRRPRSPSGPIGRAAMEAAAGLGSASKPTGRPGLAVTARGRRRRRPAAWEAVAAAEGDGARLEAAARH
uniref:Uncharacterized protein n=1 Tax=Oryza sativa subsp. japonica TaxID=39947 RepID=Q6Z7A8_ORYSJ|nr:hypothetical protein [Oryza sativa Japonica Group]BAD07940.1 hypothetical protein [Oryza sativa Japonica Group]